MSKNSIPNIWTAQEKVLHLYRIATLALAAVSIIVIGFLTVQPFRNPMVIVRSQTTQEFYPTERKPAQIEKSDVETFTKQFLANLYAWNDFDGVKVARAIGPFSEEALVSKVIDAQSQRYVKELKGKRLTQAITFVEVKVLDDRVNCRFDRVLKIEGIPLVIPTEVSLSLVQGDATYLNPMGIYVTAILENSNAK
jgi:hypothetical protein